MDNQEADLYHLSKGQEKAMKIVDMYDDWVKIDCVENGEMLPIDVVTGKILKEIL